MKFLNQEHSAAQASTKPTRIPSSIAFILTLALATLASLEESRADDRGAIANIEACVNAKKAPLQPITYTFSPGTPINLCMLERGKGNTLVVEKAGIFCASLGKVQSKTYSSGGDKCLTDSSKWSISYTTVQGTETRKGSIGSDWSHPFIGDDSIELENQVPNPGQFGAKTVICPSQYDYCRDTEQDWSPSRYYVPTYYIVFQQ